MAPARHVPVFSSAPSAPALPQPASTSAPPSRAAKRSTSRLTSPTTTSPLPPTAGASAAAAAAGARVGYARVSTHEQNPDAQHDALTADGCTKVFTDHASGTLAHRPALTQALDYLRPGDTLVITKLDRLGRSVKNLKTVADDLQAAGVGLRAISQGIDTTTPGGRLFFHMLAAIAEFEHDLVVERTKDGLAAARARGRKGGGVVKMTATKATQARAMYEARRHTVAEIAATFGVSRATIYRHLTAVPTGHAKAREE